MAADDQLIRDDDRLLLSDAYQNLSAAMAGIADLLDASMHELDETVQRWAQEDGDQ